MLFSKSTDPRTKLIEGINKHLIKSIQYTNENIDQELIFSPTTVARIKHRKINYIVISGFHIGLTPKDSDIFDIRKLHDAKY